MRVVGARIGLTYVAGLAKRRADLAHAFFDVLKDLMSCKANDEIARADNRLERMHAQLSAKVPSVRRY